MPSEPHRLLHVSYHFDPDINNLAYRMLEAFPAPAFESTPLYLFPSLYDSVDIPKGAVCLGVKDDDLKGRKRKGVVASLKQALGQQCFRTVIAHRMRSALLVAQAAPNAFDQGFIFVHGRNTLRKARRRKRVARYLDARWSFVAISNAVRDDLISGGIDARRIHVIRNAVDIACMRSRRRSPSTSRFLLSLRDEPFMFGAVSRLVPKKGLDILLHAFHEAKLPLHELAILGDGPEHERLEALSAWLGIDHQVHFVGPMPMAYCFMPAFDVFVHPSQEEGFGMVLLEAMISERPIVTTNAGGIPEVVGDLAMVVPSGDVSSLAKALREAASKTDEERRATGARLLERARARFDLPPWHEAIRALVLGANRDP